MFSALSAIRARNGAQRVPYYAHPGMFRSRAMRLPNGGLRYMDDVPSVADLTAQGADVIASGRIPADEVLAALDSLEEEG